MLSVERIRKIKDFILEYKQADVNTLSAMLSVSEPTVRRDLEKLEADGFIERVHGGATLIEAAQKDTFSLENGSDMLVLEKRSIANKAVSLITEGDVVFLGHGFICSYMARLIKELHNITVVTNNAQVLREIGGNSNVDLVMTGGNVHQKGADIYMLGELSAGIFDNVYINKAFFTVDGISLTRGYTMQDNQMQTFYRRVAKASSMSVVVAEYSKFDQIALMPFLPINGVQTVVTNENINNTYKEAFFDNDVQLFTAVPVEDINAK